MNVIRSGIIAVGALAVLGAAQVAAQDIESIMRARERLELTESQLEGLEVIRREAVQERTTELAQMQELRSQLDAGQIQRSEVMAFMEDRREARQAIAEQRREQLAAVLDESQLERVQEMRRRSGRMGVRPGGRPGTDGPGFAPSGRAGVRGSQRPLRGPPRASLRDARIRGEIPRQLR
ncbi:MAG: hypothetical protein OEO79_02350 [Gemmatimonadota bacterium]|nr:hypothetical protein [Gemmatimonadota bacterium]MDH3422167.1 hypothetical protein [Gemmatimonadota bacterium]